MTPTGRLSFGLFAIWAVLAVILLVPGHLAINGHEVDVLHAADMALRLAEGERQHVDFMTPLGILSTWPVAALVELGASLDLAFLAANILVALAFLPIIIRMARRYGDLALPFGAITLIIAMALIYGGTDKTVSVSMYYNRWAWIAVFAIVTFLLLPKAEEAQGDAIVIGICLAVLVLIKATYFIALAPVVGLVLLMDRNWQGAIATGLSGLGVAFIATLLLGFGYWGAYLGDLLAVSSSVTRPNPGMDWSFVLSAPEFLPGTLLILLTVGILRKAGAARDGLILMLLIPSLSYIVYQNWGNDQKWLILLGFLSFIWAIRLNGQNVWGFDAGTALRMVGAASLVIIAPSLINMTISPLRNALADRGAYMPLINDPAHDGLLIERARSYGGWVSQVQTDIRDLALAPEDRPDPVTLGGEAFPICYLENGYIGRMAEIARRLEVAGFAGKRLALIDTNSPLNRLGDFAPVPNLPPWYYGGTDGIAEADFVVMPICPVGRETRTPYVAALNAMDVTWRQVHSDTHFQVFVAE